jgi:hypothetical protein
MRRAVVLLALTSALLSGCELVADFDRGKIPTPDAGAISDGGDAGELPMEDAATVDSAIDAGGGDEDAGS